jgi:hypothetical protein
MVHYVHAHSCRTLLCKFISIYLAAYRWDSDALGLALYAAQAVQIPFAGRSTGAQNYPEHSCRNTTFTQVHSISDMRSNCMIGVSTAARTNSAILRNNQAVRMIPVLVQISRTVAFVCQ